MVALTSVPGKYPELSSLRLTNQEVLLGLGCHPGVQVSVVHDGRHGGQAGSGDGADWSQRVCELSTVEHLGSVLAQWTIPCLREIDLIINKARIRSI